MAKQPKFEFTVEAVSEKEQRRLAKEAARAAKGGPTLDLERRSPGADPGRLEWVALIAVVLLLPMASRAVS